MEPMNTIFTSMLYPEAMLLSLMSSGDSKRATFDVGEGQLCEVALTPTQFTELEEYVLGQDVVYFDLELSAYEGELIVSIKPHG